MSSYGNQYLYEIRQRAVNVYQDILGQDFDDQYIGINHIRYETCHKDKFIKIRAINERQLRGLGYFLYTFTPEKVISLIDDVLALDEKITALEKELDCLAELIADECRLLISAYECDNCIRITKEQWREAARKAVETQCKSN